MTGLFRGHGGGLSAALGGACWQEQDVLEAAVCLPEEAGSREQ